VPVVTGLGAITPLGSDTTQTWAGMLDGRTGVRLLDTDWALELSVHVAATATEPAALLDRKTARTLDRAQCFALVAAREAWADAGCPDVDPVRLGVVIGSGIGGVLTLLAQYDGFRSRGSRSVSPHSIPMLMANGSAAAVGMDLGARAGVHAPSSACASGAEAIAVAYDLIRSDRADVVVCGGTEAAIHPVTVAGFAATRALSRCESPERAPRPFDKKRDGFVIGEGAGILVLESAGHAAACGRRPYAALSGVGRSSDGYHMTAPDPTGSGAARAIHSALTAADLPPRAVVHLNAHASATALGDVAEARGLRAALGRAADDVAVSATKSMTGHLLGAAGAVEAVATVLALSDRRAPAVRNLDDLDDAIDLDVVRYVPRVLGEGTALSMSFGFGGHNVALAFSSAA
jgi:3-oxoacyl-[acyl-carrier-protein] synthase II